MADCFNDRLLIYEDEDTAKYIGLWLAEISVDNFLPPVQYPDHYDEFLNTIFPRLAPRIFDLKKWHRYPEANRGHRTADD